MSHQIEWAHPVHGRITELVCTAHERELLAALHTLGMGSIGQASAETRCSRCHFSGEGIAPRQWLGHLR